MEILNLPHTTIVNKVIAKNNFDKRITAKQKRMLTELVTKMTWLNKLSTDTINLDFKEIEEIQVFKVEVKTKERLGPLMDIIDRAIPYPIIFVIITQEDVYLSTSVKHINPLLVDNSIIDWRFESGWFTIGERKYELQLRKNLDAVYLDFCKQLSPEGAKSLDTINELVQYSRAINMLEREIASLKGRIKNSKQFNSTVAMNIELQEKIRLLENKVKGDN